MLPGTLRGLHEARALIHLGKLDEAMALLKTVGEDFAAHDDARLAMADAFVAKGDRASAIPIWRAALASSPHGIRWTDSSLQLARALLDGAEGPPEARAREALERTTRVVVEAPMVIEKVDVTELRERAARLLRVSPNLTPDERARQAQAWLEAGQNKRASEVAAALLKAVSRADKAAAEAICKAAVVRAQAAPRGKSEAAADAWGEAIGRCAGHEALATALYYGGKASVSAHRLAEAIERFAQVEEHFPLSRFADDARFRAALATADEGDEAKAVTMLASIPDAYPDGDMKGEALFRNAITLYGKRDIEGARGALDRLLGLGSDDGTWGTGGRAAYYRARVSELSGAADDAKRRYASVIAEHPLTFYMLLAHARLHALDAAAARAAIDGALARETPGPLVAAEHPELASPAFDRFARLLEVGDVEAAHREASAGKLVAEGVDPEVLWTVAWMYERAGAPDLGHAFTRSRLVDYRAHWPAGRWRLAWEIAFPRAWDGAVSTESAASGIPLPLTWAIMREESAFNADAHSAANAYGLMQLITGTARMVARGTTLATDEAALRRPEVSIALGAKLLGQLRGSFGSNPSLAIAAYNSGSGAVRRWLGERGGLDFDVFVEQIPYDETRNYIKRVLSSEAAYAQLYAPNALGELLALPRVASGP